MLFRSVLFFIAAHEFTHHVHGHLFDKPLEFILNEMTSSNRNGSLGTQAMELDADGQAVFLVLQNLLAGPARPLALDLLGLEASSRDVQNNVLFSCFILSVAAYFLVTRPAVTEGSSIDKLTHPPQTVRIDNVVKESLRWCSKDNPELAAWITVERFNVMMGVAVTAIWGEAGNDILAAQLDFLKSADGESYLYRLAVARNAQMAVLAKRAASAGR